MIKALIRFIFFEVPIVVIAGLKYILFERNEVTGTIFNLRRQWRPDLKRQVLEKYLNDCFKQVQKKEKNEK